MRTAVIGTILLLLGAVAVPLKILSPDAVAELWARVWPILLFVVAITVVTELAAEAGLFRVIAEQTARWGRGRAWLLWLCVAGLATVSTIFLSLDTTAVLLTPVVVVLARHVGLNPLPFAFTTVWLANTASLLLPVSNLTNLLAQHRLGNPTPLQFASLTWAPAIVAILVTVLVIFVVFRRSLLVSYAPDGHAPIADRPLLVIAGAVVALLLPALVSGVAVWIPAVAASAILVVVFAVRRPRFLAPALLPWQLILLASGLFLFMAAAHALGIETVLAAVAGHGEDPVSLLRLAGVGAVGANAADNLPAYLAFEPIANTPTRLVALLIGVNAGPLLTPWGALATLLWHERLAAMHVSVSWRRYLLLGLIASPLIVAAATMAIVLMV
ncbi:MAG: SLC13 family permease [Terrimesophilobacter sp.]